MFTPPPSPRPKKTHDREHHPPPQTPVLESGTSSKPFSNDIRRRTIGRRTICTVVFVPIILIFVTFSTRYLVHPMAFDVLLDGAFSSERLFPKIVSWTAHDPHQPRQPLQPRQQPPSPSVSLPPSPLPLTTPPSNPSSLPPTSTSASAVVPAPTIPSNPPVLPTPFPQPFDADLTQNFSSVACFNFFSNMTSTPAFRTCRPLSLLITSSAAFINAQTNLTLLNTILWGTCNTNTAKDQCLINMDWFATTLPDVCKKDLEDRNAMAVNTLTALQAYALVRETGCQDDPTSNTYCYVNAVRNPSASDQFFYSLPLGLKLPNSTVPSCSSCLKTLLGSYASALNGPKGNTLTGLKKTYTDASEAAVAKCGTGYALTVANGASSVFGRRRMGQEDNGPRLWRWWRCSGPLAVSVFGVVMLQTLLLLVP